MKKNPWILVLIICTIALILQACKPKEMVQKDTYSDAEVVQAEIGKDSVISFLTGEVLLQHSGETQWLLADIGDILKQGDTLQTGSDGYCELQLAGISVLRVEEDTLFTLESLNKTEESSEVQIALDQGTVAAKVNKLLSSDEFTVEVPSAACGIRGTQFVVSYDPERDTVLAVQEGSVSFIPKAGDVLVSETKDILMVEPGEEVVLSREKSEEIKALFENTEDSEELEEGVKNILENSVVPLSEENKSIMEGLDESLILTEEQAEEKPIIEVSVTVEPAEATLKLNGALAGRGRFKSLLSEGEGFTLESEAYSYFPFTGNYTVESSENAGIQQIRLELEKKPLQSYSFDTNQADITQDGSDVADGSFSTEVMLDEEHLLGFTREGYNPYYQRITYQAESPEEVTIALKKTIESSFSASTTELVAVVVAGNTIYCSDKDGAVTAFNSRGSKQWFQPTNNYPNQASLPVVYNNKVYFTGSKTLDIFTFDSSGLTDHFKRNLEKDEIQFFGNSMIIRNDKLIFPTSSGFSFLDPEDGSLQSSISLDGGTRMTPALYNEKIYVVNQQGIVYKYDNDGNLEDTLETGLAGPIAIQITFYRNQGYFADKNGKICSFNPATMRLNWTADLPGSDTSVQDSLFAEGNALYVYSTGRLFRLDRSTGRNPVMLQSGFTAIPALSNGFAYGGVEGGTLKIIDLQNDREIFSQPLDENETITGQPDLSATQVFLGTSAGRILVLNKQDESIRLSF